MQRKSSEQLSEAPLVSAARALVAELERFRSLVAVSAREKLDAPRSLERAATALQQIPDVESCMRERLVALSEAVDGARRMQEQLVAQARQRSEELAVRATELQQLLAAHAALAESTKQLNDFARELAALRGDSSAGSTVDELHERISGVLEQAASLSARAVESGFPELARTSQSLRQQILSLKNKIALARPIIGSNGASEHL